VALCRKIVDLVRLHLLHDTDQTGRVRHITIVQDEATVLDVRILVQVVYTIRIEQRGPAFHAVDFVAFLQEEFGEIGPVLPRDTRHQRPFSHRTPENFQTVTSCIRQSLKLRSSPLELLNMLSVKRYVLSKNPSIAAVL